MWKMKQQLGNIFNLKIWCEYFMKTHVLFLNADLVLQKIFEKWKRDELFMIHFEFKWKQWATPPSYSQQTLSSWMEFPLKLMKNTIPFYMPFSMFIQHYCKFFLIDSPNKFNQWHVYFFFCEISKYVQG